jgi:hypothetical protein
MPSHNIMKSEEYFPEHDGGEPAETPDLRLPRKRSWGRKLLRFLWGAWLVSLVMLAVSGGVAGGFLLPIYTELHIIDRMEVLRPSLVTKVF